MLDETILVEIFFFTALLFFAGIVNMIQAFLKKGWAKTINVLQILVFGTLITLYPVSKYSGWEADFKFASMFVLVFMCMIELCEVLHIYDKRKYYLSPIDEEEPEEQERKPKGLFSRLTQKKEVKREEDQVVDKTLQIFNEQLFWSFINLLLNIILTVLTVVVYLNGN
jgi:hypothetical protein